VPTLDNAAEDWDALFSAVTTRLRQKAAAAAAPDWTCVHECVAALEQLQQTLTQERGRYRRVERELRELHAALADARAELAGTQVGDRRARHQAEHDDLTALPNRNHFRERLDKALASSGHERPALAVLFLDLDGFKPINDRHGHDTGDAMLRIVAARLSRSVRADDMVCRLGGDEFACMLADAMTREQLSHLACKLFDAVSAPLQVGALELSVRPSIGIAVCPTDGATSEALLKHADRAMYRAKRRQMGYAFFDRRTDS
jgi:diguanylate cyclase (GGDEF)-like protein